MGTLYRTAIEGLSNVNPGEVWSVWSKRTNGSQGGRGSGRVRAPTFLQGMSLLQFCF